MRAMRGMSRATMSHAEMRTETGCDESREFIEGARHSEEARFLASRRWSDLDGALAADVFHHPVRGQSKSIRTDAMAGRAGVRGGGSEPCEGARRGVAFRWIYLPVAVHRRLPAVP